jgi:hypothetical protein
MRCFILAKAVMVYAIDREFQKDVVQQLGLLGAALLLFIYR